MYKDSFLEQSLPDADGLGARPDQRRETDQQPVQHVASDHRAPIDAQVMLAVGDHLRTLLLYDGSQYATGAQYSLTRHLNNITTVVACLQILSPPCTKQRVEPLAISSSRGGCKGYVFLTKQKLTKQASVSRRKIF